MKNFFTLLFTLILSATVSAQTPFWTEAFGIGCNLAQDANGVVTTNGTWTVTLTGTNESYANMWYISGKQNGKARGVCATHQCIGTSNMTLHIGAVAIPALLSPADGGATYNAGGICSAGYCVTTDTRAESPVINCSAQPTTITLSFNYIENGDGTNDNGTVEYYNGTTWAPLVDVPKTPAGGCNTFGQWTNYSIALPADAIGNPNVKIGFRWVNDDEDYDPGMDPSFAIDSIQLSTTAVGNPPVAKITVTDTSGCAPLCPSFHDASTGGATSWLWSFPGATPSSSTKQNPTGICYNTSTGSPFSVTLQASNAGGPNSVTLNNYINVNPTPAQPGINQSHDTLYCVPNTYTSYQWLDSNGTPFSVNGTNAWFKMIYSGRYTVKVQNEINTCYIVDTKNFTLPLGIFNYYEYNVSLFPNPVLNELSITGNWQSRNGSLTIFNILGETIKQDIVKLNDRIVLNLKDLSNGIYFIQIADDKGRWTGKFVKD